MTSYVLGFYFNPEKTLVALINKNKPDWQRGKFNGIGGKQEEGESAHYAMVREFKEEAGLEVERWERALMLEGDGWIVHIFRAFGHVLRVRSMTDESVQVISVSDLHRIEVVPNLRWMIPLLLDSSLKLNITLEEI